LSTIYYFSLQFQSAYRPHITVETAVVKELADILLVIDNDKLAGLVAALLDLSATFDTVDHDVLLRLWISYGIDGMSWMWLCLYLSDRLLYVRVRNNLSPVSLMKYSVPQASVLGLILSFCTLPTLSS